MPLKIYLADLVYDTVKTNYVIPFNVAYLAANVHNKYGADVDITIFKYPKELEKAINSAPPDVLGLSNYSWNTRLDEVFFMMAKRLNKNIITIKGGPNIRTEPDQIEKYLKIRPWLDYYVLFEGESPFAEIIGNIINKKLELTPDGCATLKEGKLIFNPINCSKRPREIDTPSPYLTGWLDPFLADINMIPLMETSRGCPHGCAYCAWGVAALSKVYQRPLDMVLKEAEYIGKKSAGQPRWMFCDANFGIFPRDVEIAKKVREVADKHGYPLHVEVSFSKNTGDRNIEISEILGDLMEGYIAIQSTDSQVLKNIGRGFINMEDLKKHVEYYKSKNKELKTDVLIGLPGETKASQLKTLSDAFDMGFDSILPMNIRMLPASKYDSQEFRETYEVKTKYRPIFGSYGVYNNQPIFEIEESIRATKDMTEEELNDFKVLHWLIYFGWNGGIFKPILQLGQKNGINPALVLDKLTRSEQPLVKSTFDFMKQKSMDEWFDTPEEIIEFYNDRKNFDELVNNFVKLNNLYIASVYQDQNVIKALQAELFNILEKELGTNAFYDSALMNEITDLSNQLICKDLLADEFKIRKRYSGKAVSLIVNDPVLADKESIEIEMYRPEKYVSLGNFHLKPNGKIDLSLQNITRFLEIVDAGILMNKIRIIN